MSQRKRVTVKLKEPNPLFVQWLTEWRDKARESESKMQYAFNIALQSLKKYPLPLDTGKDCKILKGFGDKLCTMLDDKLKHYKTQNGNITRPSIPQSQGSFSGKDKNSNAITKATKSERISRGDKEYIPQYRSGGYALLLALYKQSLEPDYVGYMSKVDLIRKASEFADTSFTKTDTGSRYNAWSSMKKLLTEELVIKKSNPAKFSLTEKGQVLAKKLSNCDISNKSQESAHQMDIEAVDLSENDNKCDNQQQNIYSNIIKSPEKKNALQPTSTFKKYNSCNIISSETSAKALQNSKTIKKYNSTNSASSVQSNSEYVVYGPNSFDVLLIVDTQETCGKNTEKMDDPLLAELEVLNVSYEVQNLKVSDYTWICRSKTSNVDLILPYIVERKRMDDFASSIKDGRYYEQKFRLKRSGIQNITYLIESYGKNDHHVGLPLTSLYQAATNTAIQDGFCVKFTSNLRHTAEYLACFTGFLEATFKTKTVASCLKDNLPVFSLNDEIVSLMTLKEFNSSSVKNKKMTVKDLFVKSLIQIKGVSVEKALAIVQKYPTPRLLYDAYLENPGPAGEKLLSNIQCGTARKNIGIVISKVVYQLFNSNF